MNTSQRSRKMEDHVVNTYLGVYGTKVNIQLKALQKLRYQFVALVTVSKEYCRNSSGYLNILDRQPKVFSFSYSYVTKITLEVCELFSLSSCSLEM